MFSFSFKQSPFGFANLEILTVPTTSFVLFSQGRSCDNTLENCFFQISSYFCAYIGIIYEKRESQVPLGPLLGKQSVKAKEVYGIQSFVAELILTVRGNWTNCLSLR